MPGLVSKRMVGDDEIFTSALNRDNTVAGQVEKIMAGDSYFRQQARTRGRQEAHDRGLLNTSMGVQASEAAAYNAALPIAQADAATAAQLDLQELRGAQSKQLADIEASYKTLIQNQDSAGKLFQQTVDAINKTLLDDKLDAATKQAFVNQQTEFLKSGLNLLGKSINLNLTGLLDFTGGASGSVSPVAAATQSSIAALESKIDALSQKIDQQKANTNYYYDYGAP